jgi:hypothetical protein
MQVTGSATEADMIAAFRDAEPERWAGRGYPDEAIFTGFPTDCIWDSVVLSDTELHELRHIRHESTWLKIAGPFRKPDIAAKWVREHREDDTSKSVWAIQSRLAAGETVPPIILVALPSRTELVVMEGNKRVVAAVIGDVPASSLRFLLGTSPAMHNWYFFKD